MKSILTVVAGLALVACAQQQTNIIGTNISEKIFDLEPATLDAPSMTYEAIEAEMNSLNGYIGSYPPRFADEKEREVIYRQWLSLLAEANAYNKLNAGTEKSLYLLSELYRQGHNLDVRDSTENAANNIDLCLDSYDKSIMCNFSAAYFYLSIGPDYLDKAEKSLVFLKQHYSPKLNSAVEENYVFLYLYRQDVASARKQIDSFIKNFPASEKVAMLVEIKAGLGETIEGG